MTLAWSSRPSRSPLANAQRRVTQWRLAKRALVKPDRAVVTFTFDGFPKSALNGADVIEKRGGHAGFYATTSHLGQRSPVLGEMFDAATLAELRERRHEVGAHSHSHLDCARNPLVKVERDIAANLVALSEAGHDETVSAFAFPHGETNYVTKSWVGDVFATGRGSVAGVNAGECDRSQLRAVELGASEMHRRRALAALKLCVAQKGWLFFFTHDVGANPTDHGAPTSLIDELARDASDMGAVLVTPTLGAALCGVID